MRAIVVPHPGGPGVFRYERERPVPTPGPDQVLIRVRAFGLNRAELFTRQGHSPGVEFPRVIGIECVGEVAEDPSGRFAAGTTVATMMGGMGRQYDGSYAEYTVVPIDQVLPVQTGLSWERLGALPEMYQTAQGSLRQALRSESQSGKTLFVRGGTSSVGLAAIALARSYGLRVLASTRQSDRFELLKEQGADVPVLDHGGELADEIHALGGADYVLELIGTRTLDDSLNCLVAGGRVCVTGILAGEWELNAWNPMAQIPSGCYLTAYSGTGMAAEDLQAIVDAVEADELFVRTDRVFGFDEIVAAHEYMEANRATGKLVVRVD